MNDKIHPKMVALLESLFPDRNAQESFDEIAKQGHTTFEDIEHLTKKKDADSLPASSIH